jgi:hypothetical protein
MTTIKDLIEKLKDLPEDTRVMTRGYEGGYQDANAEFHPFDVALNVNTAWYYGPHEKADESHYVRDESKHVIVKAIVI